MHIEPYETKHLRGLQKVINVHLEAVAPGWALPQDFIAERLRSNPDEYIVDPWVVERKTLIAVDSGSVQGAVHLLRYGSEPPVGEHYIDMGAVSFLLFYPDSSTAAPALFNAAQTQMATWRVREMGIWDQGVWAPVVGGVMDVWPHIMSFLNQQGYRPHEVHGQDLLFGGPLPEELPSRISPVEGITLRRAVSRWGVTFDAMYGSDRIGACECSLDQSRGGMLPAFRGWAVLQDLAVDAGWRNKGIGGWLVGHAVRWMRMGDMKWLVLSVTPDNTDAQRFYRRFGWDRMVHDYKGWVKDE